MTRLYTDLSAWWPLMSAPHEYVEEASFYVAALAEAAAAPARSLLELGSGGGNNASHMKAHFDEVVLVDVSAGMLAHSRTLNPECEHVEADMRDVRLGRQFDAVFVHDAIGYMTTVDDLRRAIVTAYEHCKPGGAALFAPDCVAETFSPATDCGGNEEGARGFRYLEWTWDPDPRDAMVTTDYVYVMREADGSVHVAHDRHIEGLFPRAVWLELMAETGFKVQIVPIVHSDLASETYELFVCTKPPAGQV